MCDCYSQDIVVGTSVVQPWHSPPRHINLAALNNVVVVATEAGVWRWDAKMSTWGSLVRFAKRFHVLSAQRVGKVVYMHNDSLIQRKRLDAKAGDAHHDSHNMRFVSAHKLGRISLLLAASRAVEVPTKLSSSSALGVQIVFPDTPKVVGITVVTLGGHGTLVLVVSARSLCAYKLDGLGSLWTCPVFPDGTSSIVCFDASWSQRGGAAYLGSAGTVTCVAFDDRHGTVKWARCVLGIPTRLVSNEAYCIVGSTSQVMVVRDVLLEHNGQGEERYAQRVWVGCRGEQLVAHGEVVVFGSSVLTTQTVPSRFGNAAAVVRCRDVATGAATVVGRVTGGVVAVGTTSTKLLVLTNAVRSPNARLYFIDNSDGCHWVQRVVALRPVIPRAAALFVNKRNECVTVVGDSGVIAVVVLPGPMCGRSNCCVLPAYVSLWPGPSPAAHLLRAVMSLFGLVLHTAVIVAQGVQLLVAAFGGQHIVTPWLPVAPQPFAWLILGGKPRVCAQVAWLATLLLVLGVCLPPKLAWKCTLAHQTGTQTLLNWLQWLLELLAGVGTIPVMAVLLNRWGCPEQAMGWRDGAGQFQWPDTRKPSELCSEGTSASGVDSSRGCVWPPLSSDAAASVLNCVCVLVWIGAAGSLHLSTFSARRAFHFLCSGCERRSVLAPPTPVTPLRHGHRRHPPQHSRHRSSHSGIVLGPADTARRGVQMAATKRRSRRPSAGGQPLASDFDCSLCPPRGSPLDAGVDPGAIAAYAVARRKRMGVEVYRCALSASGRLAQRQAQAQLRQVFDVYRNQRFQKTQHSAAAFRDEPARRYPTVQSDTGHVCDDGANNPRRSRGCLCQCQPPGGRTPAVSATLDFGPQDVAALRTMERFDVTGTTYRDNRFVLFVQVVLAGLVVPRSGEEFATVHLVDTGCAVATAAHVHDVTPTAVLWCCWCMQVHFLLVPGQAGCRGVFFRPCCFQCGPSRRRHAEHGQCSLVRLCSHTRSCICLAALVDVCGRSLCHCVVRGGCMVFYCHPGACA